MSLGLGYRLMMQLIILPQALRIVIPGIVNTFIGLFKDTTLVVIVGIFDFLRTIEASLVDPTGLRRRRVRPATRLPRSSTSCAAGACPAIRSPSSRSWPPDRSADIHSSF